MDYLKEIKEVFEESEILILNTGAGMSADSGIPTYRGEDGSWGRWEKEFDKHITELMTPKFIADNPVYMWQRFSRGLAYLQNIQPHQGYYWILDWIKKYNWEYFAITSNVDGQLQKAGFSPEKVYEVHGANGYLQCTKPCWDRVWQQDYSIYNDLSIHSDNLPKCPNCGSLLRPNVYIFQDKTFVPTRVRTQKSKFDSFLSQANHKKIVVLEIGAGAVVKTIRHLTNKMIREHQARVIRINPDTIDAEINAPNISMVEKALNAIEKINDFIKNK
jgi:NAD-dependent SIR2 family protein deacetylase